MCLRQVRDPQLAILIARLIDASGQAPGHSILQHVVTHAILPAAEEAGDAWMAALLQHVIGSKSEAVKKLLEAAVGAVDADGSGVQERGAGEGDVCVVVEYLM